MAAPRMRAAGPGMAQPTRPTLRRTGAAQTALCGPASDGRGDGTRASAAGAFVGSARAELSCPGSVGVRSPHAPGRAARADRRPARGAAVARLADSGGRCSARDGEAAGPRVGRHGNAIGERGGRRRTVGRPRGGSPPGWVGTASATTATSGGSPSWRIAPAARARRVTQAVDAPVRAPAGQSSSG